MDLVLTLQRSVSSGGGLEMFVVSLLIAGTALLVCGLLVKVAERFGF